MANPVKLHVVRLSEKPGLCGAACAQMILNSLGKVGKAKAVQDQLWTEIKAHTVPSGSPSLGVFSPCDPFPHQIWETCYPDALAWCTYPDPLSITINNYLTGSLVQVVTDGDSTGRGITARAIASVMGGIAPAVLVSAGSHWVVVYGYRPGSTGSAISVNGQQVSEVYVHDPEWLSTQTMFTIEDWTSTYLDPPVTCGFYAGRQVLVGIGGSPTFGGIVQPVLGGSGPSPILEAYQILEQSKREAAALGDTNEWSTALRNAQPRMPMLVADLSQSGRDYYIVDFRTEERPTARMILNARTGNRGGVTGVVEPGDDLPDFLLRSDATLAWKACDQSHTPFQPFYALKKGDGVTYLRVDGEIFTGLTNSGAGA